MHNMMEIQMQCLYCSSFFLSNPAQICSKCDLYQLIQTPSNILNKQQKQRAEELVSDKLGNTITGQIVLPFPKQFTAIYRNEVKKVLNLEHEYFNGSDIIFKKDQL